jgi:hypothetical protein
MVGSLSFPSRRLATLGPRRGAASALTGASTEPKTGNYVMVRVGPDLALPPVTPNEAMPMRDTFERDRVPQQIPMARCRELLGDEALELSDDDVDAIRCHAHALAHTLIELFLQQQLDPRG